MMSSGDVTIKGITTKEILDRDNKTESLFFKPIRKPNKDQARLMFKNAFEILIKIAMSEHMYSFDGDLRKQKHGGAIGNVLTCALAVLYTVWRVSDQVRDRGGSPSP